MVAPAVYAAAGIVVSITMGIYIAWRKPYLLWPYVYVASAATTIAVLVDVCSTHTLAGICLGILAAVSLAVTFSGHDRALVVCVSTALVVSVCIAPALPVTELFVPLAIAGTAIVLGTTFSPVKQIGLRRFFLGAAAPLGIVDALFAVLSQHHPTLLLTFATNDVSIEEEAVYLATVIAAMASGLVVMRYQWCIAVVPVATGSFLASLAATAFARVAMDIGMTVEAFAMARAVGGLTLCALGWYFGPSTSPQPTPTPSSPSIVKAAPAASFNTCTAQVVLAPPTSDSAAAVLTTPSGDFVRDRTIV
ncbi:hypothetical protein H310_02473 [Aphanomyces invadans]|uniref:Uncharacterized protein n=1 Tax=Aphanomyces invadans TaxID=157072 RepID=A0A024UR84_9STRA|nr:hypothetical protein H310_02473 [Aphanomyces invadans]ETW08133.1 hypothetical protein H310_02473 [Aphanomyces invadans]|eukprot:XP_008864226.1 hypothetical protein H310_02473 [Aphanomyces invadans]